ERVDEGAVARARLLDDHFAVALEDLRLDLADVIVDERLDRLLAGENARARLTHAGRAERVGRARPAEWRLRSFAAAQQRRRRPCGAKRLRVDSPIDCLKRGPQDSGAPSEGELERFPRIHAEPEYTTQLLVQPGAYRSVERIAIGLSTRGERDVVDEDDRPRHL